MNSEFAENFVRKIETGLNQQCSIEEFEKSDDMVSKQDPRADPRSVTMRGGPRPHSVLNGTSPTSLLNPPWEGLRELFLRLHAP